MSGQAMHRVIVDGPDDDGVFRLCMVVADWPDTDIDGKGHGIPQALLGQRCRCGVRRIRTLLGEAIGAGWLTVVRPATKRYPAVYKLGTLFESARGARSEGAPYAQNGSSESARARRQTRDRRKTKTTSPFVAGTAPPSTSENYDDGPADETGKTKADVPPAPAEPVENLTPAESVTAARRSLRKEN